MKEEELKGSDSPSESLGYRLKKLRSAKGWTQNDVAKKLGTYQQRYANWENDVAEPDTQMLVNLAGLYNVTIDDILTGFAISVGSRKEPTGRGVPVIAFVSAGPGSYSFDEFPVGEGFEFIPLPPGYTQEQAIDEKIYALKVRGNSMTPRLFDGDYLYIKPGYTNGISTGNLVIFRDTEGYAWVKEAEIVDYDTIVFKSIGPGTTIIKKRSEIAVLEKVYLILPA